jgi:hypothetical protein
MPRAKAKAPVRKMAAKKVAAKKVAAKPAPRSAPSVDKPQQIDAAAVAPVIDDRRPLGSVDVDSLSGDALRAYARRAGVSPRDVAGLTEDRLRQNTKLVIQTHFELLSE